MDIGSILLGLALLFVVAFIVGRPFLDRAEAVSRPISPAEQLLSQRDSLLNALRDLDFDHATGKITDEDYAPQRAQLVAQGVAALKQLDALGLNERAGSETTDDEIERAVAARRRPAAGVDDEIEARVAAHRKAGAAAGASCPDCGAPTLAGDRFCPKCGATLAIACRECGRPARPDDQFCGKCGAKLPSQGDPRQTSLAG